LYGISTFPLFDGIGRHGEKSHYIHGWKLRGDQAKRDEWLALGKTFLNSTLATGKEHVLFWDEEGEPSLEGEHDIAAQPCSRNRERLCGGLTTIPSDMKVLTSKVRDFAHWKLYVEEFEATRGVGALDWH